MQFSVIASLVGLAVTSASAAAINLPRDTNCTDPALPADAKFSLMALRSGSEIHFATFDAAQRSLFLKLSSPNATCDNGVSDGSATFYLKDGGLFLYAASATPQQLYVDRSGMGQGKVGYTTGVQPTPRNAERTTFVLNEFGDLTMNGIGFVACPNSIDGAWSVWLGAGFDQPGGNTGCLGMSVRAVEVAQPVGCVYTQ